MLKREYLFAILILFISMPLFASKKTTYFSDYEKGYSGYATADYIGTANEISQDKYNEYFDALVKRARTEFSRKNYTYLGNCRKLTKKDEWLVGCALKEYNYQDNEVYLVSIFYTDVFPLDGHIESLTLIVVIKENSFEWYDVGFFKK